MKRSVLIMRIDYISFDTLISCGSLTSERASGDGIGHSVGMKSPVNY